MAQKVGLLDYMVLGAWAERTAINRNAEDLAEVEGTVSNLKAAVLRQGQEILWLRAVLGGLIAVLQDKSPSARINVSRCATTQLRSRCTLDAHGMTNSHLDHHPAVAQSRS